VRRLQVRLPNSLGAALGVALSVVFGVWCSHELVRGSVLPPVSDVQLSTAALPKDSRGSVAAPSSVSKPGDSDQKSPAPLTSTPRDREVPQGRPEVPSSQGGQLVHPYGQANLNSSEPAGSSDQPQGGVIRLNG
jgi:hypothetical protein